MTTQHKSAPVLAVENLQTRLYSKRGVGYAVNDVSFELYAGQTLGLVGESGSGKSLTCLSVLRLNPQPASKVTGGKALFNGNDLLKMSNDELRSYRGKHIAMILQDPMRALNPVLTIGEQMNEALILHRQLQGEALHTAACELLEKVRIPNPAQGLRAYPHHFSGGMRQRVVGAMAMAGNPQVIIADEPTTALDVTVQEEFLALLKQLQNEAGLGVLLVTHDFGVVTRMCDKVAVMYAGRIVELAETGELFDKPLHPYTQALLKSVPDVSSREERLFSIEGQPPSVFAPLPGCAFAPRCPQATDRCRKERPEQVQIGNRKVSCWLYEEAL